MPWMTAARKAHGIESLPGSLEEALHALEDDQLILDALGEHVAANYLAGKWREWDEYRTRVSSWEREKVYHQLLSAMETVVVAFAGEQNGRRVKEILESAGAASCLLCRSADQVRRLVSQQRITTVVCGYKFPDGTAEELAEDLYDTCNVLVVASQGLLDLIQNEALFRLPAPATRRELVVSVQMLLRMGSGWAASAAPAECRGAGPDRPGQGAADGPPCPVGGGGLPHAPTPEHGTGASAWRTPPGRCWKRNSVNENRSGLLENFLEKSVAIPI